MESSPVHPSAFDGDIADLLVARGIEVVHLLGPGATVEPRPFAEAEVRDGRLYLCGSLVA